MALTDNIVAYYKMDVNSSTQADSANSNDGTLTNAVYTASGKINGGTEYDGSGDYMDIPDDDGFSFTDGAGNDTAASISCWIQPDSVSGGRVIISKGASSGAREWQLNIYAGNLYFYCYLENLTAYIGKVTNGVTFATDGTWYHIVVTYDGSETNGGIIIYVNNSAVSINDAGSGSYTGMTNGAGTCRIGDEKAGSWFDGTIDEVAIWKSKELTSDEVSTLYNSGDGLQYPFGEVVAEDNAIFHGTNQ